MKTARGMGPGKNSAFNFVLHQCYTKCGCGGRPKPEYSKCASFHGMYIRVDYGCPVGKYRSPDNCVECPVGQYNDMYLFEGSACKGCPAGTWQATKGAPSCNSCSTGKYRLGGSAGCSSCPGGWYQDQEAQSNCRSCPEGYDQGASGKAYCNACLRGRFDNIGPTSCANHCSLPRPTKKFVAGPHADKRRQQPVAIVEPACKTKGWPVSRRVR